MRCALNEKGYHFTKTGRILYKPGKKSTWKLRRILKIFNNGIFPEWKILSTDDGFKILGWPPPADLENPDSNPWSQNGFATIIELSIRNLKTILNTYIQAPSAPEI